MGAKPMGNKRRYGLLGILALAFLVTACASDQGPARREIGSAENAINQAQAANANQLAPLELKTAQDKLDRAHAAMGNQDYTKARRLAEEAAADARLAEASSQDAKTKQMVRSLQSSILELRREIQSQTAQ